MKKTHKCQVCGTIHGMALTAFICCKESQSVKEAFAKDSDLARKFNIGKPVGEKDDLIEEIADEEFLDTLGEPESDFYFESEYNYWRVI